MENFGLEEPERSRSITLLTLRAYDRCPEKPKLKSTLRLPLDDKVCGAMVPESDKRRKGEHICVVTLGDNQKEVPSLRAELEDGFVIYHRPPVSSRFTAPLVLCDPWI